MLAISLLFILFAYLNIELYVHTCLLALISYLFYSMCSSVQLALAKVELAHMEIVEKCSTAASLVQYLTVSYMFMLFRRLATL